MGLGITRDTTAKFGMACFKQARRVLQAELSPFSWVLNSVCTFGWIAAQGHDVAVALVEKLVGDGIELITGIAYTGEVGHDGREVVVCAGFHIRVGYCSRVDPPAP